MVAAAVTDIRSRRIPNWLSFGGVLAGFAWHRDQTALFGMLCGFGAYLALYLLRAMGAGDVKLMAAVGAIAGPSNWLILFAASAVTGGILAVLLMIWKGRVQKTLWNVAFIANELAHLRPPHRANPELDVRAAVSLKLPHAVSIALGTMVCISLGVLK